MGDRKRIPAVVCFLPLFFVDVSHVYDRGVGIGYLMFSDAAGRSSATQSYSLTG